MEKRNAFISYSEEKVAYAKWLAKIFEVNGLTVYLSDNNAEINTDKIDSADAFVLIYSADAKKRDIRSTETEYAVNQNKKIFTVITERCSVDGQYSYYLSGQERFEIYKNRGKNLRLLVGQIRRLENMDPDEYVGYKPVSYDVSLLSEEDIDRLLSEEKKKTPFYKWLTPFSRLYVTNPTVRTALKYYTVLLCALFVLVLISAMTESDPDVALLVSAAVFVILFIFWHCSYYASVLIAKLKIKNKRGIILAIAVITAMALMIINAVGGLFI